MIILMIYWATTGLAMFCLVLHLKVNFTSFFKEVKNTSTFMITLGEFIISIVSTIAAMVVLSAIWPLWVIDEIWCRKIQPLADHFFFKIKDPVLERTFLDGFFGITLFVKNNRKESTISHE